MSGARKVVDRSSDKIKQVLKHPARLRQNVEFAADDLETAFTPDTSEADAIARETLDLMKADAERPATPMPDEYELRRASRRRGRRGSGYQSTILTDRLGG